MFNKEKFGNIINLIVLEGYNNNKAEFARTIDLDRTYISKWINQRLSSPPTPRILQKIANTSKGITTYNELMEVCGYFLIDTNNNFRSLDIQLSESIFNNYINLLKKYDLTEKDITYLKSILVTRSDSDNPIEDKLNTFAINNSSNPKKLFTTLININDSISNALINLHKNGYLCPIPIYKNNTHIDLFLNSDIIDYINFNIPINSVPDDYFAILIDNDNMSPLLDASDIALIQKTTEIKNGQIVACYSTTKGVCIIGKLFQYDNIIELSYLNAKTEKFTMSDIKFLGKVIRADVQSAFK